VRRYGWKCDFAISEYTGILLYQYTGIITNKLYRRHSPKKDGSEQLDFSGFQAGF
jgi:hypothetical protein